MATNSPWLILKSTPRSACTLPSSNSFFSPHASKIQLPDSESDRNEFMIVGWIGSTAIPLEDRQDCGGDEARRGGSSGTDEPHRDAAAQAPVRASATRHAGARRACDASHG